MENSEAVIERHPIETAPMDGKKITAVRLINGRVVKNQTASWFEGDLTAGWANILGKPLGFEPTHWTPLPAPPEP